MLAQHLRELEADAIISRHDYGELPPRVDYALTEFGGTLMEALKPLCAWGITHMEQIASTRGEATAVSAPIAVSCSG